MSRTSIGEWLLAKSTSRPRAAEIVGDLLEQHGPASGALYFAIVRVWFAVTWRWIAGVAAALVSVCIPMSMEDLLFSRMFARSHAHQAINHHWILWASESLMMSLCMWSLAMFCLVRFGFRDRTTRLALGAAFALTLPMWIGFAVPGIHVQPAWPLLTYYGCLAMWLLSQRSLRRPAACVLAAASCPVALLLLVASAMVWRAHHAAPQQPLSLVAATWLLCVLTEIYVLGRSRRWLIPA